MIRVLIVSSIIILGNASLGQAQNGDSTYSFSTLRGWKIYTNRTLEAHSRLLDRTISTLSAELSEIESRVPKADLPDLKEIPLWLEFRTPYNRILYYYDHTPNWFSAKGVDPKLEACIQIQAVDYDNMPHDSLPLLKWFAYGFRQLSLGLHNKAITRAYELAKVSGVYHVQIRGEDVNSFSNDRDYFAILSSAYFGGPLSYAPYNKERLKQLDPVGYAMIEKMWKVTLRLRLPVPPIPICATA